jgi:hypothetical protein
MPVSGGSSDEEKRLAQWVSIQRANARKGLLPVSRSSRLLSLIGDLSSRAVRDRRRELSEWAITNGRLPRVTSDPARGEENLLGHQLYRLQKKYSDGTARLRHIEALLAIPGCLEGQDRAAATARADELHDEAAAVLESAPPVPVDTARWEASLTELQAWVVAHGAIPRRRTPDALEYKVANWLNIQRTHNRNNTLSPDREARIRTIPGALEPKTGRPTAERIADLAAFRAEHGRLLTAIPDPARRASATLKTSGPRCAGALFRGAHSSGRKRPGVIMTATRQPRTL